jgi:NAD(P)-dependent dehydrogenase (short-subunit alcohol dehydrogenase family)
VTGANSGIGKATATALAEAGARTVVTARNEERGRRAVDEIARTTGSDRVELAVFDLGDLASVRRVTAELLDRCDRIDVLVNNAGLVLTQRQTTPDGYEATFAVNHLGPFLLTRLLTDRLQASAPSRIVNVASIAHRFVRGGMGFDDLQSERRYRGMQVYGRSKLANVLFTHELARRLAGTGVTANSLHPGMVATGYARDGDAPGLLELGVRLARPLSLTPEQGARTSIYLAGSPEVEGVSGKYFVKCRPRTPAAAGRDDAAASRLWSVSEQLVADATGRG